MALPSLTSSWIGRSSKCVVAEGRGDSSSRSCAPTGRRKEGKEVVEEEEAVLVSLSLKTVGLRFLPGFIVSSDSSVVLRVCFRVCVLV